MKHTILALLLLSACTGDDGEGPATLPAKFRIEAEVVSVEPGPGADQASADRCTPMMGDVDPDGPDWSLEFDLVNENAPTAKELQSSTNPERGFACQPLASVDGGWSLECTGVDDGVVQNTYQFTFSADGSGSSVTTRTNHMTQRTVCVARTSWTTLIVE